MLNTTIQYFLFQAASHSSELNEMKFRFSRDSLAKKEYIENVLKEQKNQ